MNLKTYIVVDKFIMFLHENIKILQKEGGKSMEIERKVRIGSTFTHYISFPGKKSVSNKNAVPN